MVSCAWMFPCFINRRDDNNIKQMFTSATFGVLDAHPTANQCLCELFNTKDHFLFAYHKNKNK